MTCVKGSKVIRRAFLTVTAVIFAFISLTELQPAPTAQADSTAHPIKVALVQYEVRRADYSSEARFAASVGGLTAQAAAEGAKIVLFPEYINVFLAAVPLAGQLTRAESLPEYLRMQSADTRAIMDRVWGRLARRHKLWILAGSSFVAEGAKLYNRAFVYGPDGQVAYRQDKVFLTPFEKETVRLSPGHIAEARVFEAAGVDVALTLCRDTFFDQWNGPMKSADLWVDLKANGAEFDQQARQLFTEALPERIAETKVPYGATVCLTGRFFDLFWEGRSSLTVPDDSAKGYKTIKKTEKADEEQLLLIEIVGKN
jgi:predicted amidohydrolase